RCGALAQRGVGSVGNLRRIFLIIMLVVALDFERQPLQLDLGLRLGEGVDGGGSFCFGFCYHGGSYSPSFRDGPNGRRLRRPMGPDPESRDSGFASSTRPGMTMR